MNVRIPIMSSKPCGGDRRRCRRPVERREPDAKSTGGRPGLIGTAARTAADRRHRHRRLRRRRRLHAKVGAAKAAAQRAATEAQPAQPAHPQKLKWRQSLKCRPKHRPSSRQTINSRAVAEARRVVPERRPECRGICRHESEDSAVGWRGVSNVTGSQDSRAAVAPQSTAEHAKEAFLGVCSIPSIGCRRRSSAYSSC